MLLTRVYRPSRLGLGQSKGMTVLGSPRKPWGRKTHKCAAPLPRLQHLLRGLHHGPHQHQQGLGQNFKNQEQQIKKRPFLGT